MWAFVMGKHPSSLRPSVSFSHLTLLLWNIHEIISLQGKKCKKFNFFQNQNDACAHLFTLVMKFHDRQSSERCIRKLISRHCLDKTRTRWNDFLFLITDDRDFCPQTFFSPYHTYSFVGLLSRLLVDLFSIKHINNVKVLFRIYISNRYKKIFESVFAYKDDEQSSHI